MKVMITGGAGFIGFHLARAHVRAGDEVVLVDNLAKTDGATDPELAALLAEPGVNLLRTDLAGPTLELGSTRYDVVYHLAAINGTRLFYEMPYEVARANLRMTLNVLDALAAAAPGRLIYASTSEVYADAAALDLLRLPTDESAPVVFTQPTNIRFSYGTSKFMGEFLCLRFGEKLEVPTSVVRYHNVYGPRMGHGHVVPELIARIRSGERPLRVYGGDETRAFCYVDDAIRATRLVAGLREPLDLIHVGDPREEIRIADLASRLAAILGVDVKIAEAGRRPGSVRRRCPDISRLQRAAGFRPEVTLDDGLRRTAEWYVRS